jgi:hypothetical protein
VPSTNSKEKSSSSERRVAMHDKARFGQLDAVLFATHEYSRKSLPV